MGFAADGLRGRLNLSIPFFYGLEFDSDNGFVPLEYKDFWDELAG